MPSKFANFAGTWKLGLSQAWQDDSVYIYTPVVNSEMTVDVHILLCSNVLLLRANDVSLRLKASRPTRT